MIHPTGGMVGGYDVIAAALPEFIPAIAIQSRALLGTEAEIPDFDSMASAYAAAIIQQQNTGPVHLFGFSAGSWVAHGVASRIEAAGREVGWLGLVDSMDRILVNGDSNVREIVDWHTGNMTSWRVRQKWPRESKDLPLGLGSVENIDSPFDHFGFLAGDGPAMLSRTISESITREWKRGAHG